MPSKTGSFKKREFCAACGNRGLDLLLDLPKLPLTGIYCNQKPSRILDGFDQQFLFCANCFHGQLGVTLQPDVLYDESYSFRTSESMTAKKGTSFFLSVLDKVAPSKKFEVALDFGCNDLHLLKQMENRSKRRIGIDPVWKGKEFEILEPNITVIGSTIEEVDFSAIIKDPIDLVLCRHTLEHIDDPGLVIEKLVPFTSSGALFLIETPSFESLVRRFRFDQIFHQHLQYFTLNSMIKLCSSFGLDYLGHWYNYHDWGAMAVAFTKEKGQGKTPVLKDPPPDVNYIRRQYTLFQIQMELIDRIIKSLNGSKIYGYGAAQMLPVLAYHMKNDLSLLESVLDDDPMKNNFYYQNLPLRIESPAVVEDFREISVFLTAFDNAAPILTKLLLNRPKHLILPFSVI